jgi:hypothetical protein
MTSTNPHLRRNHRRLILREEIRRIATTVVVAGHPVEIPAGHQVELRQAGPAAIQAMAGRLVAILADPAETAADRMQLVAATLEILAGRELQVAQLEIIGLVPATTMDAPATATMQIMAAVATIPTRAGAAIMPTMVAEIVRMAATMLAGTMAVITRAVTMPEIEAQALDATHPQVITKLFVTNPR